MEEKKSAAITSVETRREIESCLWKLDKTSFFAFSLITDTGIGFGDAASLKVADVFKKETLTYLTHTGIDRTELIPKRLQILISDFCRGKENDSYFLVGKRNQNPFHASTFSEILFIADGELDIPMRLSVLTCHKTYLYQKLVREGYAVARRHMKVNSKEAICAYLGVTQEEVEEARKKFSEERYERLQKDAKMRSEMQAEMDLEAKYMKEQDVELLKEGPETAISGPAPVGIDEITSVSDRLSIALFEAEKALVRGDYDPMYLSSLKALCTAVDNAVMAFEEADWMY